MTLKQVGVELVAQNANPFLRAIEDSDKAVRNFGRSLGDSGPQFSAWERIATGSLHRVGAIVTDFALNAGQALIGFGVDSVKMAGDFEATLNSFAAVSGPLDQAGLSLDDFKEKFLQLGANTKFSAQEAAEAGYELVKGGLSVESVMGDATEATLALAAAAGLDLPVAADIVAKQLGAWGDQGLTAVEATNLLTQAANASSTTVEELARGLSNTGGIAELAGAEFEDIVTSLALIAPGFSSSAEAGTALRSMLAGFTGKTKPAREAMAELGLLTTNYEKALGFLIKNGVVPAGTALTDFADIEDDVDSALRSFVTATTGAQQGTEKFDKALGKLYDQFDSSTFFDAQGNFVGMAQASQELAVALDGLSEEDKLKALDKIFGIEGGQAAAALAQQGAAGFNAMAAEMTAAGTAAEQAAKMNQGFNAIMEALGGSIDTVKIRIGDFLLPALTDLTTNAIIPAVNAFDGFLSALSKSGDPMGMLSGLAASAVQNIAGAIPAIRQAFLDWALAAAQWTLDAMPMLLTNLGALLQGAISWAAQSAITFGQQMLAFGEQAVAWIAPQLPLLGSRLGEFFNTMVNWVVDSLPGWIAQLQTLGMAAIQWVKDAAPGLGTNLGEFAGIMLAWVAKTIGDIAPKLIELASKFVLWVITDVLPELPGALMAIWEGLQNFVNTTAENIGPELVRVANRFVNWVAEDVLPYLPAGLARVWDELEAWAKNTARDVVAKVKEIGSAIVDGIIAGAGSLARQLYDSLVGSISGAIDEAKAFFGIHSPSDYTYAEIGVWILPGIERAIVDTTPALTNTLVSSLSATMDAGISVARDGGAMIGETFAGAVGDTASQVAAFQAAMGSVRPAHGGLGEFGSGGGHRIQPVMTPSQIGGQMSITNNGPQISYAPTYNSPAPPPAMDFGTLQAFVGGL